MATNFPTSLDALNNPISTDSMSVVSHANQHANANDAIEALEAKVGINGSAVTTSHDYKLSAVTGSAKALTSGTSTQSVTGLTLVNPVVTLGSDATGDIYYRNAGGVFTRLSIGATDQILAVQSGLPAWIANPSASPASTTVAGVVELATTAETETGTDATKAVTPDALHDMTTLAGKAWFLDEDNMASDSPTKTASQQSIKAYADTKASLSDVPNTTQSYATWFTWEMPILTAGSTTTVAGWDIYQFARVTAGYGAAYQSLTLANNGGSIHTPLPGNSSTGGFKFSAGKKWKAKFYAKVSNSTNIWGLGIVMGTGAFQSYIYEAQTTTSRSQMRLVWNSATTYLANSNGTNHTANTVSVTRTNWNLYELYFDGTSLYCYVNGTLAATNSTNLPTASTDFCYFAIGGDTISTEFSISPITFSLEM